jgi:TPP-dependent pyruvate/acetoin dehydrogenase alpha subunit
MQDKAAPLPFVGDPRPATPPPLDSAQRLGIRQVLDQHGKLIGDLPDPDLPKDVLLKMYETMTLVRALDTRGWKLQRSGRIDFWIPSRGQEASHVASTCAMEMSDWVFMASREPGTMLARGATLTQLFAQFFGRAGEPLKGRRLPLLLGDRRLNVVPCMTIVGSYIPHAAGAAWAAKLKGHDTRFIVYFGDGATSRGEFHSALNFAGVHKPPIVFLCQNNGWAVSTPNDHQTASATFAEKGDAYGVRNLRVDGNDALAVYALTKKARDESLERGPTLIETVTYRLGFHTSSDNPDLYRSPAEVEAWARWDPIKRLRGYLQNRGFWTDRDESLQLEWCEEEMTRAIDAAAAMPQSAPSDMFDDVFEQPTWMLNEQRAELVADLEEG